MPFDVWERLFATNKYGFRGTIYNPGWIRIVEHKKINLPLVVMWYRIHWIFADYFCSYKRKLIRWLSSVIFLSGALLQPYINIMMISHDFQVPIRLHSISIHKAWTVLLNLSASWNAWYIYNTVYIYFMCFVLLRYCEKSRKPIINHLRFSEVGKLIIWETLKGPLCCYLSFSRELY